MPYRSHGCLRCRQRRVKCDEARPSCQRCVARQEVCVGYRDDSDLTFHDETTKVVQRYKHLDDSSLPQVAIPRRASVGHPISRSTFRVHNRSFPPEPGFSDSVKHHDQNDLDNQLALDFMDNFIIRPCDESSTPGFLEHLPSLFNEVNVKGRYALRWAVQAAAFANLSGRGGSGHFETKALESYGHSLVALERSLAKQGKQPDDYDLMTVVMLDIFESLFLPDETLRGSHAQGMAHILRLRGHHQFYEPRAWGLFRLAHHRLQKERLAKHFSPLPESQDWINALDDDASFSRLEKGALRISEVCVKARMLLQQLTSYTSSSEEVLQLVREMYCLDQEVSEWRRRPEWSFKTVSRSEISSEAEVSNHLPERVEIHRDIWMAYEWNYHRTARLILHQQLLQCLEKLASSSSTIESGHLDSQIACWMERSVSTIHTLADQVLATVPQSLGNVNSLGQYRRNRTAQSSHRAIGAYLLLWPIRVIGSETSRAAERQIRSAVVVLDGIREHTGMKSHLGTLSTNIANI
ncbi:uncharacterized protein F5Z01DRAFT_655617 [Emericellopsis atlantica]|uniref:Zn(2)-C6 fungal-type domain-containing protein n=1 Tax=Emericellopsis atlantica TaxID=2614577 RepID=A0A9P8CNX7_9HYPO|nr:uncharacterized protein F5Z01DRAFT_655617 [Emericellopsis atlantica]KAG9253963.1 hypothetical protein F5Z01DRAFT_655617 [Emericellopsis atlantica]